MIWVGMDVKDNPVTTLCPLGPFLRSLWLCRVSFWATQTALRRNALGAVTIQCHVVNWVYLDAVLTGLHFTLVYSQKASGSSQIPLG